MPDYSGSYAYLNTLQSIVREGFVTKAIVDTFFTSQRFFQEIRDLVDTVNGSLALTWPINVGKSSNTIAFTGGQALPANTLDTFVRASLPWKYYADALALNITDLQQADSPEAIASLVDSQLDVVKMSIADRLASDFITSATRGLPGDAVADAACPGVVSRPPPQPARPIASSRIGHVFARGTILIDARCGIRGGMPTSSWA